MKTIFKFFLIYSIILICKVFGQSNTQNEDTTQIRVYRSPMEILISAPRVQIPLREIPAATSVVNEGFLQTMPKLIAPDEALKLVPGIKVDNQANGERIHLSIRGQGILTERGIRGIKILLDEIPINDPTGFAPDFFDIDFNNIEQIEVLRGLSTSLYGGSASGGIIDITTKNSPDVPMFGNVFTTAGSNNFWKAAGQFGGKNDKVNYNVSFSRTIGDGYRLHTHFWGNNVYAKVTYTPSNSIILTPIFGWTDVYHENPEGINLSDYKKDPTLPNSDAIPFNEFLQTRRTTNALKGLILLSQDHEINFNTYIKRTLFTEANNHTFNHRTILTPGVTLQYTFNYGKPSDKLRNKVSIGSDLQWQKIVEYRAENLHAFEDDTLRSKENIIQSGVGFFLIDNLGISKNWNVMVSLRYDKIHNKLDDLLKKQYQQGNNGWELIGTNDLSGNVDFSKATGRVGISYSPLPELNLFASWGQGFLPPATEELAQNPDQFGGFNKHLTSSTSNGVDIGVRGTLIPDLFYDITGFYLTTKNDFDRYRITDSIRAQETFYRNIGSSRRIGIELYCKYIPIAAWQLQLAYTYSNFKYTNPEEIRIMMDDPSIIKYIKDGNYLPNSPVHQLYADIQYNPIYHLSLGISAEMLSKSFIDGANLGAEAVDAYTLLNFRIGYKLQFNLIEGELSLSIRNLTDKKYIAFSEPDPGGNAYQPGAGRELFGGIRINL